MLIDGREVSVEYYTYKSVTRITVSFKGKFFAHAKFRKEGESDRRGKSLGMNKEIQLNDPSFNSKVYIECEDEFFINRWLSTPEAREHLVKILKVFDVFQINGNQCLMIKSPCEESEEQSGLAREAAVLMLALADKIPLPDSGGRSSTPLTDKSLNFKMVLIFLAALIFCTGLGLMLWGMAAFTPVFPGGLTQLFQRTISFMVPAAGIVAFFLVTSVWGRSSNSLFMLLFLSLLGIVLGCWGGALIFNGIKDTSPRVRHEVSVSEKYVTHSAKHGNTYYIRLSSWRDDLPGYVFSVSRGRYNRTNVGAPCAITTQSGALGVSWCSECSCEPDGKL